MSDQEKDPVVTSSLGTPLVISSVLLLLSLAWGLYDEVWGTRPWNTYQAQFVKVYSKYLKSARPDEAKFEAQIKTSPEYKQLDKEMLDAENAVRAEGKKIDDTVNLTIIPQTLALNTEFQVLRSEIGADTYEIEVTKSESGKNKLREEIAKIKQRVVTVKLPNADGSASTKDYKYDQMDADLKAWMTRKRRSFRLECNSTSPPPSFAPSATSSSPIRSPNPLPIRWPVSRRSSTTSPSRFGRSMSRMSIWWTAVNPAIWAHASLSR